MANETTRWWCGGCKQWVSGSLRDHSRRCPKMVAVRDRLGIRKARRADTRRSGRP